MAAQSHTCNSRTHTRAGGFTIVELMIAVAIMGVLAAIAAPVFTGYLHKSRTSEATKHLGLIKLQQESYRSSFGLYAKISGNTDPTTSLGWTPALGTSAGEIPGDTSSGVNWPGHPDWTTLGAAPRGSTRFAYRMAASLPNDMANVTIAPYNWPAALQDHWFIAAATADLDTDGNYVLFEINSLTSGLFIDRDKGWE